MPSKRGYDKTVVELRQIARQRHLKYYYRMRKAELCKALGYVVPSGVAYSGIKRDFYKLYAIKTVKKGSEFHAHGRYKTIKRAYYSKTNPAYWKDVPKAEEAAIIPHILTKTNKNMWGMLQIRSSDVVVKVLDVDALRAVKGFRYFVAKHSTFDKKMYTVDANKLKPLDSKEGARLQSFGVQFQYAGYAYIAIPFQFGKLCSRRCNVANPISSVESCRTTCRADCSSNVCNIVAIVKERISSE